MLGISFNEMNLVQNVLSDCLRFQDEIKTLLQSEKLRTPIDYSEMIERSEKFQIDLPIVERLKLFYQAALWDELVEKTVNRSIPPSKLRSLITSGQTFQPLHTEIQQRIENLQAQLHQLEFWEEKSRQLTKDE